MDIASITPILLAVAMIIVAALLHLKFPHKYWRSVSISCLIFTLPIPFLVYGISPYYLKIVSESGEQAEKSVVLVSLMAFTLVASLLVSVFTGLLVKAWAGKRV